MATITIASDFHDDYHALQQMIDIADTHPDRQVILLGDFFDSFNKHSEPKQIAALLTDLAQHPRPNIRIGRGNHDQLLLDTVAGDDFSLQGWLAAGADKTLPKLGLYEGLHNVKTVATFMKMHYQPVIDLLQASEVIIDLPDLVAVHAGLDLDLPDPMQTSLDDALWIRGDYYFESDEQTPRRNPLPKPIVSGHTPVQMFDETSNKPVILQHDDHDTPRYLIDGGSNSGCDNGHVNIVTFVDGVIVD